MSVPSSTLLLIASLVSGLLCCSEHGAAQNIQNSGYAARRQNYFNAAANYRNVRREQHPYHQNPQHFQYDSDEEDYEESSESDHTEIRSVPEKREPAMGMQASASYAQPVKSERTVQGRIGGYKSGGYGTGYVLTLMPGAIAITCTVKDPLEHIMWLRSLCPDDYDRGDIIARGAVSNFPDAFSVSVSGEDGTYTSTLTILKPRTQMGSGVFRCEAWPHHPERRHRRQVEPEGRAGRAHHDPWNAIILGGAEMVDECFYNSYDGGRQYRAMGRSVGHSDNAISSEAVTSTSNPEPGAAPASSNLFPEFDQHAYFEGVPAQLENPGFPYSYEHPPVSQVEDNREQRHAYPSVHSQLPFPAFGSPNSEQPIVHFQARKVNVQSGNRNVRADVELSTGLEVHPSSEKSRVAYSRTIHVEGEPEEI
ncbi:Hypothetical predicted protein [Cloeon dipterum]|uniref:Ig-like domain-containing protein n=1 Tax=Cloeon dipterum TaxID=197152 RepID=A0A8S1D6L2_9INSE|nr:Hypothetical predicted protein [Cloeon dipterum]